MTIQNSLVNELEHYFAAPEAEAEAILKRLFREELLPQLEQTAKRRALPADMVPLVVSDAALSLLTYLRSRRGSGKPPRHMEAFLRVTVENAHTNHLRRHFAPYVRFKNRVRFALENTPELNCWNAQGTVLAAYVTPDVKQRGVAPLSEDHPEVQRLLQAVTAAGNPEDSKALRRVLLTLLRSINAPVAVNELTAVLAGVYGLSLPSDIPLATEDLTATDTVLEQSQNAVSSADALITRLDNQEYLMRLWREIKHLRPHQRAVILLNLRDSRGHGVLELFPELGIASLKEIRATIEEALPLTDALWEQLREEMPLSDGEVARWLTTSTEAVYGLRRAARERLQRKMRV